jgi:aspartate aminotransferase
VKLARRLARIRPSATLAIEQRARQMRAQGIDIVGLAAGEPDFDTPAHIKQACREALDRGDTKYTAVAGTAALRAAAARWLADAHGLEIRAEELVVSCGAKHSLYNVFMALLDDGDEVVVPTPAWVSYPDMIAAAGGQPVSCPTRAEDGYRVRADDVARLVTPRTRALVLNSPSNPTGTVYRREDLLPLADLCVSRDLLIVSDDIYRSLVYDASYCHVATLGPEARARTVLVDGVSKAYAMTGFRIGFCAAPRDLADAIETVQSQSTSNPTSIAQAAALAAVSGPQDCVETMRLEFDRRRKCVCVALAEIPGVRCFDPRGAFYAFPDVSALLPPGTDDIAAAARLLEEHRVAVVPGTPFGAPGHLRVSYACAPERLAEGLRRLSAGLRSFRG